MRRFLAVALGILVIAATPAGAKQTAGPTQLGDFSQAVRAMRGFDKANQVRRLQMLDDLDGDESPERLFGLGIQERDGVSLLWNERCFRLGRRD